MGREVIACAAVMLLGVLISSVAQVLLKKAARRKHGSLVKEYLNLPVIAAYAIFFAATLLTVYAYRVVPLSMGAILEATGYLYVTAFGVLVFREKLNLRKLLALALILSGIGVYALLG